MNIRTIKSLPNLYTGIVCLLLSAALINACKNDKLISEHIPVPADTTHTDSTIIITNSSAFNVFHDISQAPSTVVVINAATDAYFTGSKGTTIRVDANSLVTKSGLPPTGFVRVEFKELLTTAEMILNNKQTVGTNGELLQSGGEIYLDITSGGESLQLKSGKQIAITLPKLDVIQDMLLLGGAVDSTTGTVAWNISNPVGFTILDTQSVRLAFLRTLDFKWINIDKIIDPGAGYSFHAGVNFPKIPGGEIAAECFLVIRSLKTVAGIMFNAQGKAEILNKIPAGTDAIVVCILMEEKSKRFFFAKQSFLFNGDVNTTFVPVEMTEAEVKAILATL